MDPRYIAHLFREMADILEICDENPFKIRAYHNAARTLDGLTEDLKTLVDEKRLEQLPGIGKNLADHIRELFQTGHLKQYTELKKKVPAGLLKILEIPGVGPKKVKILWKKLNITSIEHLKKVCQSGEVAELEGFGEKTQENILQGIHYRKEQQGQFLWSVAMEAAEKMIARFKDMGISKNVTPAKAGVQTSSRRKPGTRDELLDSGFRRNDKHGIFRGAYISIAGSLRRGKEIVKDVDLVVATRNPEKVMQLFVSQVPEDQIVAHGETKSSIRLNDGIPVDLRCVTPKEYPYALHHFTGSKEHNTVLRGLAKERGLKMNEYGLFRGEKLIPCTNEAEIFKALGMDYIPPELRENRGEIEAAQKGRRTPLVKEIDIHGVFHCHTTWSDGAASLEEMARGAQKFGFEYIGIADHSEAAHYAGGLDLTRVKQQHLEINALNKKLKGIHIFKGIEADILPDGTLDMSKALSRFEYIIASVHSKFNMTEKEMTKRIMKAISHPCVSMLGHMTGRLLLAREAYPVNIPEVIQACADYGVAIEINGNPNRLDIDWRHIPYAKEKGVLLVINPDAHSVAGIEDFRNGVMVARKGGLTANDVLNTKNTVEISQWIKKRNSKK